jgi:hypothetical protein
VVELCWTAISGTPALMAIDARSLPLGCLSRDPAGAPYLRYFNHKLARERFVPISPRLAEQLRREDAWVGERFPAGEACLLPRPRWAPPLLLRRRRRTTRPRAAGGRS